MSVRTARASLWGRADRLDARGEGVVVVDYKTGRSVLTVDDARSSLALAVYAAGAARMLHRPCTRVELHHLPTGDTLAWEHTPDSLAEHLARADAWAARLAGLDERFAAGMSRAGGRRGLPRPGRARAAAGATSGPVCGPGQSVPPRQPWAGVVDDG